jgi:hypothetical protein
MTIESAGVDKGSTDDVVERTEAGEHRYPQLPPMGCRLTYGGVFVVL